MINIQVAGIQKLNLVQTKILVGWARDEGWNPGPYDAEVFWQTDPDGFYGYFHNKELIAGGAIISYNDEFGFMGLFIVKPEYRALGLGKKLWYERRDLLIGRLKRGASIGMDGVVDMQSFYGKGGFKIAFRDCRYELTGEIIKINGNVMPIEKEDYQEIVKYDNICFGLERPQFIIPWLNMSAFRKFKYIKNGKLCGFAVLRKATIGYKIGPLFANDFEVANELYKACLNSVPKETVYLDIPLKNPAAVRLVEEYNAKYVFECARMYYGTPPNIDSRKVYGITTFELG